MQRRSCSSKENFISEFNKEIRGHWALDFETQLPGTIWKMILVLANVVREKLVDKIKQSDGYVCLTKEVTDIQTSAIS